MMAVSAVNQTNPEVRVLDDISISGPTQRIVSLNTGESIRSILDVRTITAGVTLTVNVWYIDPGQKSKRTLLFTHGPVGVGKDWITPLVAAGSRSTGLFRVEYTLSAAGSATVTHTIIMQPDTARTSNITDQGVPGIFETRVLDDITLSVNSQRVFGLQAGLVQKSILDVRTVVGGITLTVTLTDLDPGGKSADPFGPNITHAAIGANTVDEADATVNISTNLLLAKYVLSGPGSVTLTHTVLTKTV